MPYIAREDGERFVIPSYRDTLIVKKANLLKREMMLLATNYGEYATLQKKGKDAYEVAFSTDSGYLLGETVWAYFNRPQDLIYCEAIPNTTEAILVIVKAGNVYLDGSFPVDTIAEELVIFRTQQNEFDIYIHGDVPISQTFEENKFNFDDNSVHSFNVLENPVFQSLPKLKTFQLQLVDAILKSQGIGTVPLTPILIVVALIVIGWMGWGLIKTHEIEIPTSIINVVNPYQVYISTLTSPSPDQEIQVLARHISRLLTIPGWFPTDINYSAGSSIAAVKSRGAHTSILLNWAKGNNADVKIQSTGFYVSLNSALLNRPQPTTIYKMQEVIATLIDRIATIMPGNPLEIRNFENKGQYIQTSIVMQVKEMSLSTLLLLGQQFKGLPLVLSNAKLDVKNGFISGTLNLVALGN